MVEYNRMEEGRNLRERLNVYSGILLGAMTPVAFGRYAIAQSKIGTGISNPLLDEAAKWGISLGANLALSVATSVFPKNGGLYLFPLLTFAEIGDCFGRFSADRLYHERRMREIEILSDY